MRCALSKGSLTWSISAALLLGAVSGCGDNQDDAGARQLLARVRADDYRGWERAPGWPSRRASGAPHGEAVDIYVNDVIGEVLTTAEPSARFPENSIIVKDGWDGTSLELIAVMEKRNDGWYWAEFDSDGEPFYSGRPDVCIDCHRSGSDYVRAFRLP
jgi:hypothetical protein